MVEIQTSFYRE